MGFPSVVNDQQTDATNVNYESYACPYLGGCWPFDSDLKNIYILTAIQTSLLGGSPDFHFSNTGFVANKVINGVKVDPDIGTLGSPVPLDISISTLDEYAATTAPEWSLCGWITTIPKSTNDPTNISYPNYQVEAIDCDTGQSATTELFYIFGCHRYLTEVIEYGTYVVPIVGNSQYFMFFHKQKNTNALSVCLYIPYNTLCIFGGGGDIAGSRWYYPNTPRLFFFVFPEIQASDFLAGNFSIFIEISYTSTTNNDVHNEMYVYLRPDYLPKGNGHFCKQIVAVPHSDSTFATQFHPADSELSCHDKLPPKPGFLLAYNYLNQSPYMNGMQPRPYTIYDNWSYYNKCIPLLPIPPTTNPTDVAQIIGPGYLDLLTYNQDAVAACKGPLMRREEFYYRRRRQQTG